LLFFLVLARVAYRWRYPPPPLPESVPVWQRRLAALSHGLLYALLIALPIAGYIRVKAGGFPIETLDAMNIPSLVPRSEALADTAKAVHYVAGVAIACVIGIHIAAATFHALILRDGVFSRMWPGKAR
jgi:cytochrome b561